MSDIIVMHSALPKKVEGEKFILNLTEAESSAKNLLAQAERAEIKDESTYAKGGDLVKIANNQSTGLRNRRLDFTKPFRDFVSNVNDACKVADQDLDKAVKLVKCKMMDWKREEDRKRAEAAKIERDRLEAEALERAAAAQSEEDQESILDTAAVAGEAVKDRSTVKTQYGSFGSTSSRKVYRTEVLDTAAFLQGITSDRGLAFLTKMGVGIGEIVDLRKSGLNKLAQLAIKAGVTEASGAKFEQDETLNIR